MTLTAGSRLGPYEILVPLGAGGMGEVWRARDTKLGREVALKVLPPSVALDTERLQRFEREAQVLASLNHPHIATIYGVEDSTETKALVLELVDGPTLEERVAQGPLPAEEAVAIARQIAEALEAAHEKGVIHRDLKPANVKLTPDGSVKVLDFGLAKALDPSATSSLSPSASPTLMNSPTLTAAGTQLGVILGTAAYMAPEQAKGAAVDKRADIWSFGLVLHEMLTGERLFAGDSVAETLAGVLKSDIDLSRLPATVPDGLRHLLRRCLERNPKNRLHDIADARILLDEIGRGAGEEAAAAPLRRRTWRSAAAFLAVAALALAVGTLAGRRLAPAAPAPVARWALALPEGMAFSGAEFPQLALSPDGRLQVAVVSDASGVQRLLLRSSDEFTPRLLASTDGASTPFFSPDGAWVGFFRDNALWKIAGAGGAPVHLADASTQTRGATWSADGFIYYVPDFSVGLSRVSQAGGAPTPVTRLDEARDERTHRWPQALPDGSAVLFTCDTQTSTEFYDDARIEAVRPATGERKVLVENASMARYVPDGHLVFARGGALYAVGVDPRTLTVTGSPVQVAQDVATDEGSGAVQFTASASGDALWAPGEALASTLVLWVDRHGAETAVAVPEAPYNETALSPDGKRALLVGGEGGVSDLWVADLERGALSRLTNGEFVTSPVWSPDGRQIAYGSRSNRRWHLARRAADGSRDAEILAEGERPLTPTDYEHDGSAILYSAIKPDGSGIDLYRLPLDGDRRPELVLGGPFAKDEAVVSPDGRWLAYTSNEGGAPSVFVRPYPSGEGRWQISTPLGVEPRWSQGGGELFYRDGGTLYRVAVDTKNGFSAGRPERLFDRVGKRIGVHTYSVSPDDSRFFTRRRSETTAAAVRVLHFEQGFARRLDTLTREHRAP